MGSDVSGIEWTGAHKLHLEMILPHQSDQLASQEVIGGPIQFGMMNLDFNYFLGLPFNQTIRVSTGSVGSAE